MLKQATDSYDVVILGGGLAGLTLALQCHQKNPTARIGVLEKHSHPVPEAAFKVGESTVEVGAHYFTKVLGLEKHINEEQLPKNGLRFFFGAGDNTAIEPRLEVGGTKFPPVPSYQLDRGRFENFLAEHCTSLGIEFIDRATVEHVHFADGRADHRISFVRDREQSSVNTRWVADASGTSSILKRQLGLAKPSRHHANAVWFRVGARINVDDWSTDSEWQRHYEWPNVRWLSTNHLMGPGYWVWIIPLSCGSTSIGIVADAEMHPLSEFNSLEKALEWLKAKEPQCADEIGAHQAEIQDFLARKQYSVECKQLFSSRRWGIVGDAGFFLDPFYSPGSDFIAIGNDFLSELIRRDLSGRSNKLYAPLFDRLFKTFYRGTMTVFQDQYQLFGNHQVMPVKILWDWMVYWTITGFNVMHGRTTRPSTYIRHVFKLKRLNELNGCMQKFFIQWHQQASAQEVSGSIDTFGMPMIVDTNRGLEAQLNDKEYAVQFAKNVQQMETLFWEIIDHADIECDVPLKRRRSDAKFKDSFRPIFDVTSQGRDRSTGDQHSQQLASGYSSS
jgi:flavin-dependent dehydrogenase